MKQVPVITPDHLVSMLPEMNTLPRPDLRHPGDRGCVGGMIAEYWKPGFYESLANHVMSNPHDCEAGLLALQLAAVLPPDLPIPDEAGENLTDLHYRAGLVMGSMIVTNVGEAELMFSGDSRLARGAYGTTDRRLQAWGALQVAMSYEANEGNPTGVKHPNDAIIWLEKAVALDERAAASWGAWHMMMMFYEDLFNGILASPNRNMDFMNIVLAVEWWVCDKALSYYPNCVTFSVIKNKLYGKEAYAGELRQLRSKALIARSDQHENTEVRGYLRSEAEMAQV